MKYLKYIHLFSLSLAVFLVPHVVQAQGIVGAASDAGGEFFRGALQAIGAFFIFFGSFLLWLSAILFNFSIEWGILNFANFANMSGVPIAWTVLRDISNILFIFIFLAIGIATILGIQQYGVKKLLPVLLVIAVLINFSLFFTKVTIDIAHAFAGAILNQSGVIVANSDCAEGVNCNLQNGIAAAFMEKFGVVGLYPNPDGEGSSLRANRPLEAFTAETMGAAFFALLFGILGFAFLAAVALLFLAASVILIMRIVRLLLLLITSAPAFAAYILPGTRQYFNMWLQTLLKEAFFAPLLFLLFAISLLILSSAADLLNSNEGSLMEAFSEGGGERINIIFIFIISYGFLYLSLTLAQKFGVSGAQKAMGIQKWGQGVAGRPLIGGSAAGLQNIYNSSIARAPAPLRAAVRGAGLDLAISDNLAAAQKNTFGSGYSYESKKEAEKKRGTTIATEQAKLDVEKAQETGNDEQIQEALQKLSDAQLQELSATRLATEEIARNLTPQQLKKVLESDKFSEKEKDDIRAARFKPLTTAIKSNDAAAIKNLAKGYSKQELESLPRDVLSNPEFARALKGGQVDDIKKSDAFTAAQKKKIIDERMAPLKDAVNNQKFADAKKILDDMPDAEVAKLPTDILTSPTVMINLTPQQLAKIQREDGVSSATKKTIGGYIRNNADRANQSSINYINKPNVEDLW